MWSVKTCICRPNQVENPKVCSVAVVTNEGGSGQNVPVADSGLRTGNFVAHREAASGSLGWRLGSL